MPVTRHSPKALSFESLTNHNALEPVHIRVGDGLKKMIYGGGGDDNINELPYLVPLGW